MVPGYLHRHPGSSEFIIEDQYQKRIEPLQYETAEESKTLLMALGELQTSVNEIVDLVDNIEKFYYGLGSFAQEPYSAAIYLLLLCLGIAGSYFARFLPVVPGIIIGGWMSIILKHPAIRDKAKHFKQEYMKKHEHDLEILVQKFAENEIVPDSEVIYPEEVRDVEVFELEKQGLTPRMWDPWVFTTEAYDLKSETRMSGERPIGAESLDMILAPKGWYFDNDYRWVLDPNTKSWIIHKGLRDMEAEDDQGHWAYDYETAEGGERGEWRRRRWIRPCFRGAYPPRKPAEN